LKCLYFYFMGRFLMKVKIQACWYKNSVSKELEIYVSRNDVRQKTWMLTITTLKPLHIVMLFRLCIACLFDVKFYVVLCRLDHSHCVTFVTLSIQRKINLTPRVASKYPEIYGEFLLLFNGTIKYGSVFCIRSMAYFQT
jgi:hypothetical protein